jgi:hypothetical protein
MSSGEVYTGYCYGDLRGKVHLENLDVDGRKILKLIFRKRNREASTELLWLRMGIVDGHL